LQLGNLSCTGLATLLEAADESFADVLDITAVAVAMNVLYKCT
jgi:hypothetical protein